MWDCDYSNDGKPAPCPISSTLHSPIRHSQPPNSPRSPKAPLTICPSLIFTSRQQGADIDNPTLKGLIPRITEQIFASISQAESNIEYTVKVSYMEIYMERIKDLLARESRRALLLCACVKRMKS